MAIQSESTPAPATAAEEISGQISELRNMIASPGWKLFQAWLKGQSSQMLSAMLHPDTLPAKRQWLAGAMSMHQIMSEWARNQLNALEQQQSKMKEKV